jgi:hypothetical protein
MSVLNSPIGDSSFSYPSANESAHAALLHFLREAPLTYGPWKRWKSLYKRIETDLFAAGPNPPRPLVELFVVCAARLDLEPLPSTEESHPEKSKPLIDGHFVHAHVAGSRAYLLDVSGELVIVDISVATQPRVLGRWHSKVSASFSSKALFTHGNYVVLVLDAKVFIVDVSEPVKPSLAGRGTIGYFSALAEQGGFLFATTYGSSHHVATHRLFSNGQVDIGQLGQFPLGQYPQLVAASNSFVLVSLYSFRETNIQVLDVSNPEAIKVASLFKTDSVSLMQVDGNRVLTFGGNKLHILELDRTGKLREVGAVQCTSGPTHLTTAGSQVYTATYDYRQSYSNPTISFEVVDITVPSQPRRMGAVNIAAVNGITAVDGAVLLWGRDGLRIMDVSDPARLQLVGRKPSAKTFGYMKRRARRALRTLAEAAPDQFVEVAAVVLQEAGAGRDALDFDYQWISVDLLYGTSERFRQTGHGRGGYKLTKQQFVYRRREERAADAWERHPERAMELWTHPHLPWQTQEAALKVLRSSRTRAPDATDTQLGRLASGSSPSLVVRSTRRIADLLEKDVLGTDPAAAAAAIYAVNPRRRRALLSHIETATANVTPTTELWKARLATRLAQIIGMNSASAPERRTEPGLSGRQRRAALLLAARFNLADPNFSGNGLLPALSGLLQSGEAPLREVAFSACRRMNAEAAVAVLRTVAETTAEVRESAVTALTEGVRGTAFDVSALWWLLRDPSAWLRESAWRLLAASSTTNEALQALWERLWKGLRWEYPAGANRYSSYGQWDSVAKRYVRHGGYAESMPLQTALASDAALDTLVRCDVNVQQLRLRSVLAEPEISGNAFTALSLILDGPVILRLIVNTSDARWQDWAAVWPRRVTRYPAAIVRFWNALQAVLLPQPGSKPAFDTIQVEKLRGRVLQNPEIAATLSVAANEVAPDLLVQVISLVHDDIWNRWRAELLQKLQTDAAQREAFWRAVRMAADLESGTLAQRIFEDAEIIATFALIEEEVLEADNPRFEPLLLVWLQGRQATLHSNKSLLIKAATHSLTGVRDWGLAQLQDRGIDLPVALRLIESGLPPSIAVGKQFFEAEPRGGPHEAEYALALCDSPRGEVRAWGQDYIAQRATTLASSELLHSLTANPNSEMQAFLAERLLLDAPSDVNAVPFDRAVLRTRGKGRRAKELVKKRLDRDAIRMAKQPEDNDGNVQGPNVLDTDALLELARSRSPRDAEWALMQLARRAVAGEVIKGIDVHSTEAYSVAEG